MNAQVEKRAFLAQHHPFDALPQTVLDQVAGVAVFVRFNAGAQVYGPGDTPTGLFLVRAGQIGVFAPSGERISQSGPGESVGARALLRGGIAENRAVADLETEVLFIAKDVFLALVARHRGFDAFYDRVRPASERRQTGDLTPEGAGEAVLAMSVRDVMTADPVCVDERLPVREAAAIMDARHISCVLATRAGALVGILTTGDITGRVVAGGRSGDLMVRAAMTSDPVTLSPETAALEALTQMSERAIGHLPVIQSGRVVGIVTRTNLLAQRSLSAGAMISEIAAQTSVADLARIVRRMPQVLAQLVGIGVDAHRIGRILTGIADTATRRLIALAKAELGPAPVPFLWLACGSQGRQEQAGVGDQDNCMILDDGYDPSAHGDYFEVLAQRVTDGLNEAGYVYCPGQMMASNPRWRQPLSVWRDYFRGWIDQPDPMAQMLASVMFDLRPIAGDAFLFEGLQRETLARASRNSIFRAHLIANSIKHAPPLTVLRGFALIRTAEHKDTIDLKHNGLAPIVDLARVYALEAGLEAVNTRDRLVGARDAGVISVGGGDDLLDAYDLIASVRLEHQARQVRQALAPDNFLAPASISALNRNHLKDAFSVIKTMQAALAQRGA